MWGDGTLLKGKVAIVTGGSRGIGRSIALDLGANGADIALTFKTRADAAEDVVKKIEFFGRKAKAYQCDSASFAEVEKTAQAIIADFGKVDILVNNAGINRDAVSWKMSEEQWDEVMNTNLKGYFNFVRFIVPLMRQQNYGRIINITSINGLRGKFGQTNYSAAKAGVIGFTKALAKELGKSSITVNAVAPGLIETDILKDAPEKVREMALAEIVLGRIGSPEDVAYLVTFLSSDLAKHITGEVIKVDGGQYI
jgi:3-oxoacyl-[acyl-carrier protein] reductase